MHCFKNCKIILRTDKRLYKSFWMIIYTKSDLYFVLNTTFKSFFTHSYFQKLKPNSLFYSGFGNQRSLILLRAEERSAGFSWKIAGPNSFWHKKSLKFLMRTTDYFRIKIDLLPIRALWVKLLSEHFGQKRTLKCSNPLFTFCLFNWKIGTFLGEGKCCILTHFERFLKFCL